MTEQQTSDAFLLIAVFARGCASIIANQGLRFDEQVAADYLDKAYHGALCAVKEETP